MDSSMSTEAKKEGPPQAPAKRRRRRARDDGTPIKRRTKSGCLTCRRRRIKCDEGGNPCHNCERSKRPCEYAKPTSGNWPTDLLPADVTDYADAPSLPQHQPASLAAAAAASSARSSLSAQRNSQSAYSPSAPFDQPPPELFAPQLPLFQNQSSQRWPNQQQQLRGGGPLVSPFHRDASAIDWSSLQKVPTFPGAGVANPPLYARYGGQQSLPQNSLSNTSQPPFTAPMTSNFSYGSSTQPYQQSQSPHPFAQQANTTFEQPRFAPHTSMNTDMASQTTSTQSRNKAGQWPGMSADWTTCESTSLPGTGGAYMPAEIEPTPSMRQPYMPFQHDVSQCLEEAAVPIYDEDYYDVNSDDEDYDAGESPRMTDGDLEQDLERILTLTQNGMRLAVAAVSDPDANRYPGFSIGHYYPENVANPLGNPYTQRVFAHFVFSTGPLISFLQQRNRPGDIQADGQVLSCQGLWTYTMARMALYDLGLQHAMLAMSSYHIAKIQRASTTPAAKHYGYAIKYIHRNVRPGKRRHAITTLAATLLLAFYEIMTADHRAWNTHLAGAIQLISEFDFRAVSAHIKYCKYQGFLRRSSGIHSSRDQIVESVFPDVDPKLANKLMGKKDNLDAYGRPIEDWPENHRTTELTDVDIRHYTVLQDLFWYACRHDIIHGLVGANPLMLDYSKWGDCLPRGPIGQEDAIHGTFDHLMLLLGRLIKFMSKDRPRKIRAQKAAMSTGSATPSTTSSSASHQGPPRPPRPNMAAMGPDFYGLAPSQGLPHLPRGFEPQQSYFPSQPPTPTQSDLDLATRTAIAEWDDIMASFDLLANSMGPAFQPLPADSALRPSVPTPFGPSITYRSQGIAAIWAWYYGALVIAHRAHPSMPAKTVVAVGAAAKTTAPYAHRVGQILYNITPDFLHTPIDSSSAGSFSECCLPLFLAGVQFMTIPQRNWTLQRLQEIENATGWATISLIANGCESGWLAAHAQGHGDPWTKRYGVEINDDETNAAIEDVSALAGDPVLDPDLPTPRLNEELREAHLKHVQRERNFAAFTNTKRGGELMWAYKLYTDERIDELDSVEEVRG